MVPTRDRKHLITFQQKQVVTDPDYGGQSGSTQWIDVTVGGLVLKVWAKRTNMLQSTAEQVLSGGVVNTMLVRFDIAARNIDPAWRIVDGAGTIYDIKTDGISNENDSTSILAIAGASNG